MEQEETANIFRYSDGRKEVIIKPTKESSKLQWFKYWSCQSISDDLEDLGNEVAWLQMKLTEAIEIIEELQKMKIRASFVTNSSSSSFIVAFDKLPETQEELQFMLFGNEGNHTQYDYTFPVETIAKQVWRDMQEFEPAYMENGEEIFSAYINHKEKDIWDLAKELSSGSLDDAPQLYHYEQDEDGMRYYSSRSHMYNERYRKGIVTRTREDGSTYEWEDADYALYQKDCDEWAFKKAQELIDKYPDSHFFTFSYADEDGQLGCVMEHGGIFDNLKVDGEEDRVIRISHH